MSLPVCWFPSRLVLWFMQKPPRFPRVSCLYYTRKSKMKSSFLWTFVPHLRWENRICTVHSFLVREKCFNAQITYCMLVFPSPLFLFLKEGDDWSYVKIWYKLKWGFPHLNLPLALRSVAIYGIVLRSHLVTCNRNDYGSAWCCRMPPDIRIPIDMHDYSRGFWSDSAIRAWSVNEMIQCRHYPMDKPF